MGIGTSSPAGTLDVNGAIYQRGGVLHADYVFEDGHPVETIEEHARQMWAERHLPAIPAAERDQAGREVIEIGRQNRGLLEELEKAHIYIEQLNTGLQKQQTLLDKQQTLLDKQQAEIESLRREVQQMSSAKQAER